MSFVDRILQQMVASESQEARTAGRVSLRSVAAQAKLYAVTLGYFLAPLVIALIMAEIPAGSFRLWAILSIGWYFLAGPPLMVWTMTFSTRSEWWTRRMAPEGRVAMRLAMAAATELLLVGLLFEALLFNSREHRLPFPFIVLPIVWLVAVVALHPVAQRAVSRRVTRH